VTFTPQAPMLSCPAKSSGRVCRDEGRSGKVRTHNLPYIYIYILFCTVEEMKHCKYIHLHRFRSIDSYSMHKTLPQPVLSKNASPHHLPWIQRLFVIIISLKTSSLFPMPTMTSNNNIRTESIAKLFSTLHELSCT
jgi:hypothetical protein